MELFTPIARFIINGGFLTTVTLLRGPKVAHEAAQSLQRGNIPAIKFEDDSGPYIGLQLFDDPVNPENFQWLIQPRKTNSFQH